MSVLVGAECSASCFGRFIPQESAPPPPPQYLLNNRLGGPRPTFHPFGEKKNVVSCWESKYESSLNAVGQLFTDYATTGLHFQHPF